MKEIKYLRAFQEAMAEEMRRDPKVLYLGEDIGGEVGGPFGFAKGLQLEFGKDRVFDTPDSEGAFIGLAIGLAATGYRPVVDISFMDFMLVAMDQIVNMAAKVRYMSGGNIEKLPMVIHTAAGAGLRGGAQHSASLESLFVHIPGLKVVAPSNPYDLKGILKSSIRDDNPVIVMKHKFLGMKGQIPEEEYTVPLGKAFVKKDGNDVTLVGISRIVNMSLQAASELQEEDGISVEVIDPLTLSPLDKETIINSVKKTGRLVIVHEAWKPCGMGAEIGAIIMEECFDFLVAPLIRVTANFNPMPYGALMEDFSTPNVSKIKEAVRKIMRS